MNTKQFHICHLLLAGRSFLCWPDNNKRHYDVADEIICFMHSRESGYFATLGLGPGQEACEVSIIEQFPFIKDIILPTRVEQEIFTEVDYEIFAQKLVSEYGEYHEVYSLMNKPSDLLMAYS